MKHFLIHSVVLLIVLTASAQAQGAGNTPQLGTSDAVLATMGDVSLTQKEIDAAISRIPADKRLMFVRDGEKVEQLVRNLLTNKALSNEALKADYDQEPLVKLRLELDRESSLAKYWLDEVVADAPAVDYEAIAEENYLLNPEAWRTQDAIDITHILISNETRSDGEARDLAAFVWQLVDQDASRFDDLVAEYSEDPSKTANGGRFENVRKNDMVPNFEKVAFALENPGDISAPTETPYGYHIIRLNEKKPGEIPSFAAVKEQAIKQAQVEYVDEYRKKYLRQLLAENIVLQDGAAEELARRYFGENLELAPDFSED